MGDRVVLGDVRPAGEQPGTVALGGHLEALRAHADLSQRQLARLLGVTDSNVSMWERGVHMVPRHRLGRLAEILHTTQEQLEELAACDPPPETAAGERASEAAQQAPLGPRPGPRRSPQRLEGPPSLRIGHQLHAPIGGWGPVDWYGRPARCRT